MDSVENFAKMILWDGPFKSKGLFSQKARPPGRVGKLEQRLTGRLDRLTRLPITQTHKVERHKIM